MLDQTSAFRPLALADRIEQFGLAMTATQLAALPAVSKIAIYKYAKGWPAPLFPNRNLGSILSKSGSGLALRTVRVSDEPISLTEILDPVVGEMAIFQQLALILR
jgi:hypothetical protein